MFNQQGMLAVGLFVSEDLITGLSRGNAGLFHGGGFYLLGVQVLAIVCLIAWSTVVTYVLLTVSINCQGSKDDHDDVTKLTYRW